MVVSHVLHFILNLNRGKCHAVDEGIEIPRWLCCWFEMIREYGDMEVDWVEES
jgi:hypothetical protein